MTSGAGDDVFSWLSGFRLALQSSDLTKERHSCGGRNPGTLGSAVFDWHFNHLILRKNVIPAKVGIQSSLVIPAKAGIQIYIVSSFVIFFSKASIVPPPISKSLASLQSLSTTYSPTYP